MKTAILILKIISAIFFIFGIINFFNSDSIYIVIIGIVFYIVAETLEYIHNFNNKSNS